jgi:hypothetical protein
MVGRRVRVCQGAASRASQKGRWTLETYLGVWFFTTNDDFFRSGRRAQAPLASGQVHVEYLFRPRLWVSGSANVYVGGRTRLNDRLNLDLQKNSRGGTAHLIVRPGRPGRA